MKLRDEPLDIEVEGQTIEGTLLVAHDARAQPPGVLFVHGWGGNRQQYLDRARCVAALGCACLTFDLRGHEKTQAQHETVTREQNLRDVLAAYDALARCGAADRTRMALVASSYGAYLGALLAAHRPVRWMALRAPALYKDAGREVPKRKLHQDPDFAAFRRRKVSPAENRALAACAKFHGDVLVVESEDDRVMPHPVIANYLTAFTNAHSLTYRVIQGADHGLSSAEWKQAWTDLLVTWLREMTAPARGAPQEETPLQEEPQAVAAAAAALPES
ncbi:MAG: alpha/beta hydrolase family protein [Betaproteobacteria bacterium]